jgi:hypothetical protein
VDVKPFPFILQQPAPPSTPPQSVKPKVSTVAQPGTQGQGQGQAGGSSNQQAAVVPPMTTPKGPSISTPTAFTGDRSKTNRFIHELTIYIKGKPHEFQDASGNVKEDTKIMFALSYMKGGTAGSWAEKYLERPDTGTVALHKTYDAFIKEVKSTFKEHNQAEKARARIDALKQGKYSVDTYTQMFNELSRDSGYDAAALMHLYLKGLNNDIVDKIYGMADIPDDLEKIQDRAALFYLRKTMRNQTQTITPQSVLGSKEGSRENPIHIDRQYVKLSNEEREELMAENKCFLCKKTGHRANRCPENKRSGSQKRSGGSWKGKGKDVKVRSAEFDATFQELLGQASIEQLNDMALGIRETLPKGEDF